MATLDEVFAQLKGKTALSADDALAVRRALYGGADQTVTPQGADMVAKLNTGASDPSPEWLMLFDEVMLDYLVNQATPVGYVDPSRAAWLMSALSTPMKADETQLVIEILEKAETSPPALAAFVLDALKEGIQRRTPPAITAVDISMLRRVLFAAAGPDNIGVSRAEAEALFDLNDAMGDAANDAAWPDFFARAVANSVLYEATYHSPDAQTELRREAWLGDTSVHLGQFLSNMVHLRGIAERTPDVDDAWEAGLERDEAIEQAASAVTGDEAHWLAARLDAKPGLDAAEQALVAFLAANASAVDPSLRPMIERLSAAPAKTAAA